MGLRLTLRFSPFSLIFRIRGVRNHRQKVIFSATGTRLSYPSPTDTTSESHYGGTRHATPITPIRCTLTWRLESLRGFYSLQRFLTLVIGLQLERSRGNTNVPYDDDEGHLKKIIGFCSLISPSNRLLLLMLKIYMIAYSLMIAP